ncbi:hypothetical protein PR048_019700 [Dryococelus australis]|uniref:C2H2-type domain-containing protein n=1 Tax=Dryococelus australis TaxID=614101 RepID=A0ABQ9H463_9NEOP|nr:hypothetical protein PR048_019700 [Dryococelus australis]
MLKDETTSPNARTTMRQTFDSRKLLVFHYAVNKLDKLANSCMLPGKIGNLIGMEHGFHQQINNPALLPLYSGDKLCVKNETVTENRKEMKYGRTIEEILNVGDNSEYARAMQRSDEALYNVRGIAVEGQQHYMTPTCVQRSCNVLQQAWHGFDTAELRQGCKGHWKHKIKTIKNFQILQQTQKVHPPKVPSRQATQSGEKPFCCPVCAAEFFSKSNMTRHMRLHNGDKGLTCTVCSAKFKQKDALRSHMFTHTGDKAGFSCSLCNAKFSQKCDMTRHICVYSEAHTAILAPCAQIHTSCHRTASTLTVRAPSQPWPRAYIHQPGCPYESPGHHQLTAATYDCKSPDYPNVPNPAIMLQATTTSGSICVVRAVKTSSRPSSRPLTAEVQRGFIRYVSSHICRHPRRMRKPATSLMRRIVLGFRHTVTSSPPQSTPSSPNRGHVAATSGGLSVVLISFVASEILSSYVEKCSSNTPDQKS